MNSIAKPHACHSCDKSFNRSFNLRRHIVDKHGDNSDGNEENPLDEEENESESERSNVEHSESEGEGSDEKMSSNELEDNTVFLEWLDQAKEDTREMRLEKYEKYVADGMEDDLARKGAHEKIVWTIKRNFFDTYGTFLEDTVLLKEDETHQDILADIDEKTERGMDAYKAVRRVLPKHKHKFESLFEYDADEDSEGVEDDQPPAKRIRPSESEEENSESEEEDEDAEVSSDDLEDNVAYLEWYNRAKEDTQEMRAEKYEQFISDGMEDEQARIRAHEKIIWAIKSKFFDTYSRFLEETVPLKEDETHQDILLDIEDKTEKGIDAFKAVKRVLPKHKQKFESLFQYKEDTYEDSESVEDTPNEPPVKRMRPFPH